MIPLFQVIVATRVVAMVLAMTLLTVVKCEAVTRPEKVVLDMEETAETTEETEADMEIEEEEEEEEDMEVIDTEGAAAEVDDRQTKGVRNEQMLIGKKLTLEPTDSIPLSRTYESKL